MFDGKIITIVSLTSKTIYSHIFTVLSVQLPRCFLGLPRPYRNCGAGGCSRQRRFGLPTPVFISHCILTETCAGRYLGNVPTAGRVAYSMVRCKIYSVFRQHGSDDSDCSCSFEADCGTELQADHLDHIGYRLTR
jgi:hypothetical protein